MSQNRILSQKRRSSSNRKRAINGGLVDSAKMTNVALLEDFKSRKKALKLALSEASTQIARVNREAIQIASASDKFIAKARTEVKHAINATTNDIDMASEAAKNVTNAVERSLTKIDDTVKHKLNSASNTIDTASEFARRKMITAHELVVAAADEAQRHTQQVRNAVIGASDYAKTAAKSALEAVNEADLLLKDALNNAESSMSSASAKAKDMRKKADTLVAKGAAAAKQMTEGAMHKIDEVSVAAEHLSDLARDQVDNADTKVKAALDKAEALVEAANDASKRVLVIATESIEKGKDMADYVLDSVDRAVQQVDEAATQMFGKASDAVDHADEIVKSGIVMMSDAVKESVTISKQFMEEANDRVSEVRTKAKEVTVAANEAVNAASTKGKEITRAATLAIDRVADTCSKAVKTAQKLAHKANTKIRALAEKSVAQLDDTLNLVHGVQNDIASKAKSIALRLVQTTRKIIPGLETPLTKMRDISVYVDKSLTCISGMIPPIKQSVALITQLFESGGVIPISTLNNIQTRLAAMFDLPLRCAVPDILDPLSLLFRNFNSADIQDSIEDNFPEEVARTRKLANQAQNLAKSIIRAIPMVRNLISTSLRVYSQIRDLISVVAKHANSLQDASRTGGFSQAAGAIREFKNGVSEIVLALRELRELLAILPIDEDTLLLVFETAEKTLVGLEAGCDMIIEMMISNTLPVGGGTSEKSRSAPVGLESTLLMQLRAHGKAMMRARQSQKPEEVMFEKLNEKITSLEKAQEQSQARTGKKLDNLQMTTDNIAIGVRQGRGTASTTSAAGESSSGDEYTERALRRESKQFQKRVMSEQKRMTCPMSHSPVGKPGQIQIVEKSIEMLIETIQVPTQLTYGIDVRVGILLHVQLLACT